MQTFLYKGAGWGAWGEVECVFVGVQINLSSQSFLEWGPFMTLVFSVSVFERDVASRLKCSLTGFS